MLKLNSSFSKKVPVQGQDFSSQSFHCSVEVEIPDGLPPEALQRRIHETFELVKSSVETELNGKAPLAESEKVQQSDVPGNNGRATNRQIKFILDLARGQRLALSDVNRIIQADFGRESVYELDKKSASQFLDQLKKAA